MIFIYAWNVLIWSLCGLSCSLLPDGLKHIFFSIWCRRRDRVNQKTSPDLLYDEEKEGQVDHEAVEKKFCVSIFNEI